MTRAMRFHHDELLWCDHQVEKLQKTKRAGMWLPTSQCNKHWQLAVMLRAPAAATSATTS
jgi:hypothetical protein